MHILNIAGYKFTDLSNLETLQEMYLTLCQRLQLAGTILLSHEGINLSLAGEVAHVDTFKNELKSSPFFSDMTFRESFSDFIPFKRLKVKIKKEIITFKQDQLHPEKRRAPAISPEMMKKWLDEDRDVTILDTRNDYEVRFGTFKKAMHLGIQDFTDLAHESSRVPRDKPIIMFCTGGIRCEKAGLYFLEQGFHDVYQLEGGILNYFQEVGGDHYEGECFVFDERVALNPHLNATGTTQCTCCHGPIPASHHHICQTCQPHTN